MLIYKTDDKLLFQNLDMSMSKDHLINSLKTILQKETAKNILIGFIIKDETANIRELFCPYTDDQIAKYFSEYIITRANFIALPKVQRNPFEIYEKSFSVYQKDISSNILYSLDQLKILCVKNLNFFILPNLDDMLLLVNENKGKPYYIVTKQTKRIKQFLKSISQHRFG